MFVERVNRNNKAYRRKQPIVLMSNTVSSKGDKVSFFNIGELKEEMISSPSIYSL